MLISVALLKTENCSDVNNVMTTNDSKMIVLKDGDIKVNHEGS